MQVKIPFKGTLIPNVKFNWTLSDRDNDIWQQIGNTRLDLRYTQRLSVLLAAAMIVSETITVKRGVFYFVHMSSSERNLSSPIIFSRDMFQPILDIRLSNKVCKLVHCTLGDTGFLDFKVSRYCEGYSFWSI